MGLKRMFFVDGNILCRPIDFTGGSVDESLQSIIFKTGIEKMGCANDIGLNKVEWVNIGIRNGDEGAQMKDFRTSFHCLFYPIWVFQVARNHFNLALNIFGQIL